MKIAKNDSYGTVYEYAKEEYYLAAELAILRAFKIQHLDLKFKLSF